MASKFKRQEDYERTQRLSGPINPPNGFEIDSGTELRADYRVITGIGFRMNPGDITTMRIGFRKLDPATGNLGPVQHRNIGTEEGHALEVEIAPQEADASENILLAGIAVRADPGNFTTLKIITKNIQADGTLDDRQEWSFGNEPGHVLETIWEVPDPSVIVSVGLRANPGNVTHIKGAFGKLVVRGS